VPRKPRPRTAVRTEKLPLLPLRETVIFPRMVSPLLVGRSESIAAVDEALTFEKPVFLCTQRDPEVEEPELGDLYTIGVAASILQTQQMPDGSLKVVVEGLGRGRLVEMRSREFCYEATVAPVSDTGSAPDDETQVLMRTAVDQFDTYIQLGQRVSPEVLDALRTVESPGELADMIAAYIGLSVEGRQALLDALDHNERLERLVEGLMRENELLDLENKVRDRVRERIDRGQREHYLQEQLRAIHQELGGRDEDMDDAADLRELVAKAKMPKEVREKAERELGRYQRMPPMSPEGAVIRTYLEWLVDMPWRKRTNDTLDLIAARKALDEDHYGLAKVKERILDYLAVRQLSGSSKGPVLCLVGPPGVGKTSLGKSIARAMKRKFVRISLGGVRDEAEIRGHRRTYIGSLPGRIVQSMKRVGVRNPVFMLDEIDKLSMDYRGDPSSALLEVLDPEQNNAFSDHYLEVDVDLHEVFFITTANSEYDIPEPLHDRMEIVRLSGYTANEKAEIAKGFLIPKQMKEGGLTDEHIRFEDSGLDTLIARYTREAGVRELERRIAQVCRKVARKVLEEGVAEPFAVTDESVRALLGPEEYSDTRADALEQVGLAVGLAWTWSGGDILNIETSVMKGKGELILTGQLGEVMKESAQAAYSYLRAHAAELEIPGDFHQSIDIHVHVPEGAIPKDGPSAGTALAVSIVSALRGQAPRSGLAMTGELTLRGRVLQIGGVKEKVLAAHRAGIRTVILPKENRKDLVEVPKQVQDELEFVWVDHVDEVFKTAFPTKPAKKKRAASKKKAAPRARKAAAKK